MRNVNRSALLALLTFTGVAAGAQQREQVSITVRSTDGAAIPSARVKVTGGGADTTARTDEDGVLRLMLRHGSFQVSVAMIGYQPRTQKFELNGSNTPVTVALARTVQQLDTRNVAASWIGVRGVVGDSALSRTLDQTNVRSTSGALRTKTDSAGRFEMRTDNRGPTILLFDRDGYRRKQVSVNIDTGASPDIAVLLYPGKEPNMVGMDQFDLAQRLRWMGSGGRILDHEQLVGTKARTVEGALLDRKINGHNAMWLGQTVCVFENGVPQPTVPLSVYLVQKVEFVELWRNDETKTLERRWRDQDSAPCSAVRGGATSATVRFVGVWLRK